MTGDLRRHAAVPGGRPARRWPTPSCGATSRTPPRRSAPSAPPWSPRCRLGGPAAGRRGDQGRGAAAPRRATWCSSRSRSPQRGAVGALGPRRRRGLRDRRRRRPGHGVDEVVKVKSMATQEIELNEALAAAGHRRLGDRPGRADRPARRRPAEPHPGAGDPPQPGRDPRDLPPRMAAAGRPAPDDLTDEPADAGRGRAPPPAGEVPAGEGRRSPAPTSRSPRPARSSWSSPRATAGCA